MSKPILVVRFPYRDTDIDRLEQVTQNLQKQLDDYHTLFLMDSSVERIEFECFNAPHTEADFEELKAQCLQTINSNQ